MSDPLWYLSAPGTEKASDWHLVPGQPLRARIHGAIVTIKATVVTETDVAHLQEAAPRVDDALEVPDSDGVRRFRVHRLSSRKRTCMVVRTVPAVPPTLAAIAGLPAGYKKLLDRNKGLILVGGATGAGKSTTVAASLDYLNRLGGRVLDTLEDPIEFYHEPLADTVIYQQEFGDDFHDWAKAIGLAMREDPDVIYVAEMRDVSTIEAALRAAETGHLVFATVHGGSPVSMIDRIISAHSGSARDSIAALLANICIGFLAQDLIKAIDGGRLPIFEFLLTNSAAAQTIRENRLHQIRSTIVSGRADGMQTFDSQIESLLAARKISLETAKEHHSNPNTLQP